MLAATTANAPETTGSECKTCTGLTLFLYAYMSVGKPTYVQKLTKFSLLK